MFFFKKGNNGTVSDNSNTRNHIMNVIKNTGNSDMIIFRQPEEDFNTNSKLIVMPGEMAVFVNKGEIESVFQEGTYALSTGNYPFISKLSNIVTGGVSSFHCFVYFVRTADTIELHWGTDRPIDIFDKEKGIITSAKVRAVYKLNVENPSLFLKKLIGSKCNYQSQNDIVEYFAGEFQSKIRSSVAAFLSSVTTGLIGVEAYLETWSEQIKPKINESVKDYGLVCTRFTLVGIKIEKSDYKKISDAKVDAMTKNIRSQGDRMVFDNLGTTYEAQKEREIRQTLADNTTNTNVNYNIPTVTYGQAPFGTMPAVMPPQYPNYMYPAPVDPVAELRKYKSMLDEGLITQEDYDNKKRQLIS